MAIQKINLGTEPLGEGGDTYRSANTKINENFSNTTHAASRLVGTSAGQIPLAQNMYSAVGGTVNVTNMANSDVDAFEVGTKSSIQSATNEPPSSYRAGGIQWCVDTFAVLNIVSANNAFQMAYGRGGNKAIAFRNKKDGEYTEWVNTYTTANTLKEEGTGHLYTSSPVILLRDGTIDKVHEAEDMDCELIKNGTGDYTLKNTTGLREDDWHAVPPKDVHGNPLCMIVVAEPSEGVVNVKTYKRKFDLEKAAVVPDLEQPFNIPEGTSVRLHFNDLPQEELDEYTPEPEDR